MSTHPDANRLIAGSEYGVKASNQPPVGTNSDVTGLSARFDTPSSITYNRMTDEFIITDTMNNCVKVVAGGKYKTLGTTTNYVGGGSTDSFDHLDYISAGIQYPISTVLKPDGNITILESNGLLRNINKNNEHNAQKSILAKKQYHADSLTYGPCINGINIPKLSYPRMVNAYKPYRKVLILQTKKGYSLKRL